MVSFLVQQVRPARPRRCGGSPWNAFVAISVVAIGFLAVVLPGGLTRADEVLQRFSATETQMGTSVAIVLYAPNELVAKRGFDRAFERFESLNAVMSDYDSASELNRLASRSPTDQPVPVSDELFQVMAAAQDLSQRSDGAFDVTVGPLSKLWRRARRRNELPDPERLAAARRSVGYRFLKLDSAARTVQLLRPEMRLDLGGIAKGFAADEALEVLRDAGVDRALVNAGGDVAASGPPPGERGWRVGVAPLDPTSPPDRFLLLSHGAVATSGDAWQYLEIEGRRYSHILDPRTGLGLADRSSVTVYAADGMTADSLASAVSVLPVEPGLRLIDATPGAAARVVRIESRRVVSFASQRWRELDFAAAE